VPPERRGQPAPLVRAAPPTGATGPTGPAGVGGALLKDKNGNSQGYLISYGKYFNYTVEHSGYLYQLGVDGTFPIAQIWWTGANCTGTPYLNDGIGGGAQMLAKNLAYSVKTNLLYTLSNPNALGISTSVAINAQSIENPTCMNEAAPVGGVGSHCHDTSNDRFYRFRRTSAAEAIPSAPRSFADCRGPDQTSPVCETPHPRNKNAHDRNCTGGGI
jgi:hypothetical protein